MLLTDIVEMNDLFIYLLQVQNSEETVAKLKWEMSDRPTSSLTHEVRFGICIYIYNVCVFSHLHSRKLACFQTHPLAI